MTKRFLNAFGQTALMGGLALTLALFLGCPRGFS
jgi:hypothetical protein